MILFVVAMQQYACTSSFLVTVAAYGKTECQELMPEHTALRRQAA